MKKATLTYLLAAIQAFLLLFLLISGILQGWVLEHGDLKEWDKAVAGSIHASSGSQEGHRHDHGEGSTGRQNPVDHDTLLNINRQTLVAYHKWAAVTFVGLTIAHRVLNWSWIASMSRRIFGSKQHP